MAEDQDILEPPVQTDSQPATPPPSPAPLPDNDGQPAPDQGGQPPIKDQDKQRLVKMIQAMKTAGEPDDHIKLAVKRFMDINYAPPPDPVHQAVQQTTQKLNEPLTFNGTFKPDLEGEKNGLYLNDPEYQKQKQDFVSRIATDEKGVLLYPEQDEKGNWSNYYTKQPLPNFDPRSIQGKILQVPYEGTKQGIPQFITPKYNEQTGKTDFPSVQSPDAPTQQTLPQATVYGSKKPVDKSVDANLSGPVKMMVDESDRQGGQLRNVLAEHPELATDINGTLNKYGEPYKQSIQAGSQGMANVLQKTVDDKFNLNEPLPSNIDRDVLNGHLNILNNFEKNKNEFEANQNELQHQADLITDRSKRTGQPISTDDAEALAQKAAENLRRWNAYIKAVNYAQNYVNTPEVKNYLSEFQKRQQGLNLIDEIKQRSFPDDTNAQLQQDAYDRKAVEGNTNALDYLKTAAGAAAKGFSNIGESVMKLAPGVISGGMIKLGAPGNAAIEKLNNNAQQFLGANLPAISPDAIEQISKGKGGLSLLANDMASTIGGFAPYIIPGAAGEGLAGKAATFATALAENLPTVRKEAESAGLTGAAYNTYVTAKPLVDAAFMSLLPNAKFAKGFDSDVAKMVVDGEFNNPKQALLKLATKVITPHPGDIAHLQAMLSGTNLGNNIINQITNSLQAKDDIQRGIARNKDLPVEMSNIFDPKQTVTMALAGKVLEGVPSLKNAVGDFNAGKDVAETYGHIQNNLVELAANNSTGVSAKVDELLKKDPGNIYAQHLKSTLEDFAHAEARMPSGLEPEQKAALFSIQREISQKQRQSATADPVYAPHLQKNIDELNKQIPEILKDPQKANDYLKDSHKAFVDNISSPKTDDNGKTESAPNAQTEGQQGEVTEKPKEGTEGISSPAGTVPSIETNAAYRTLDYGDNKGKDETPEEKQKINEQILNDEPVGKSGEKFSDLLNRVIPNFSNDLKDEAHNTTIVTHSSVIKALHVWEEMGRPDISEIKGDKLKEFAQKYVDMKPEAEGKVHTFTGANGNDMKVIRHGETEDNKMSEFRENDTQLTDKGQAQAANAGDNLIKETGGNIPKLISSDLPRTIHTSEIIKQKLQDHVRQQPTTEVLQREQVQAGSEGSGRGRVEPSQQGQEPAGESGQSGQLPEEKENKGKKDESDDLPFIDEESDNEFTSTKNEITKQKIEEAGLKQPMQEAAREFGTVWKDAQTKLSKGFDIEKLIKSLDSKPRAVTDLENAMILFHQNVKESQLDAANKDIAEAIDKKKPEDLADAVDRRAALLDDLQKIYNVDKKIGRETARGLNARKMMADRRFSLVNMQMEKRVANGGEPLTDAQNEQLQKQYEDIKSTKEALDKRIEELTKENARLAAEKNVAAEKAAGRPRKSKAQFKEERKDIVQRMRADLLRAAKGGEGLTSSIPLAAQLKAVAPHIAELVKSFISEGVGKLEDITKNIMDILKPNIPELEERHVHDLIAGVYDQPKEKGEPSKYSQVKAEAKVQKYRATDPKLMKLQADYERAKDKYQQGLDVDQRKSRTAFEKTLDAFQKYERAAKLSNPITLGKLAMAAITRLSTTPIEEGVGAAYSAVLPGIAKKAPGEAGINVSALAKGYKAAFMRGLDDMATVAKGGKTDIEAVYGKKGQAPPEALDFFGQLHSAIKAPVKRFAFERSFQKRLANNIKNGVTIDGMTEARIAMEAYKDAQRSIFMQDNIVSKGWTNAMAAMERGGASGELAASIGRWLVPFVKVPTNILGETISHVAGPEIALGQIISKSLGKGLKNLSQDEAESIMRNLKKGTIGNVALMAGYLNPQVFGGYYQNKEKRDPKDVKAGDMRINGANIPAWALEAPLFQAMQLGATVRRIKDQMVKGHEKGIGEGIWGGALGLLSHEPLIDEPSRLGGMMASPTERQYFLGELTKSTLVPAASDYAAKVLDPADTRSTGEKMIEPENKRQPTTIAEHVESAIPGLRENTPFKKPTGGRHQRRRR